MLQLIARLLSERAIITETHNGNRDESPKPTTATAMNSACRALVCKSDAKPLMTEDEIRRTDKTILFIGANRPILTSLPPIASIAPWRMQIGINPFFGKPFLKRVSLRIGNRDGQIIARLFKKLWHKIWSAGGAS